MVVDGIKKFLGIGPYATGTNIVKGDPYFYKYLEDKYGKEEVEKAMNLLHKTSTITFAKQNNHFTRGETMRKIGYILKVSNGYDWQYCNEEAGACITINFNTQEVQKVNFYKGRIPLTIREVEAVAKEIKRRRTEYNKYVNEYNITPGR